jgi:2-polyprenyl-3-methyl-5-hydroxy-6-metoxy-1,4-benzoquinol methylase
MSHPAATTPPDVLLRDCPLCGSPDSTRVFDTIRNCKRCGLKFVSPLANYRGEHEPEEYFVSDYLPLQQRNWENSLAERRAHLDMICRYSALSARPRLLDVGCALGMMLQEAEAAGWEAVGVETSDFAARYAMENTGCKVYKGTLQQADFAPESFDVVTLMDVIEHLPQPCALLAEVYRVLRPDGVAFIVTPNFGSLFVWLYGQEAYGIGPEEHVTYFQQSTLKRALRNTGFRDIMVGSKDFYADNVKRLLRKHSRNAQTTIKSAFGAKSSLSQLRRVANSLLMKIPVGDKLIALAKK